MAEVTWKATFTGAFLLFLIGLVVATCLNYAAASIASIKAGLTGVHKCYYNASGNSTLLYGKMCNDTGLENVESCTYIYVSFSSPEGKKTDNIKLSPTYRHSHYPQKTNKRMITDKNGNRTPLGECSADYCGKYRFKDGVTNEYKNKPDIIVKVEEAAEEHNGTIYCYLNTKQPSTGAYLYLNTENVEKPEHRMFRWYEGWLIITSALAAALAIVLYLVFLFFKVRTAATAAQNQKPKSSFVPPGFAPVISSPDPPTDEEDDTSAKFV